MSWLIAILAVVTAQGDGGTSSSVPTFHEPMTRPVPMKPIDWRLPFELRQRGVTGLAAIAKVKSTRYTPVTLDGKPVRVRYVYNIRITGRGAPVESLPPTRWRPVDGRDLSRFERREVPRGRALAAPAGCGRRGPRPRRASPGRGVRSRT